MSKHRNHSLYFAYGANLNLTCISKRCPSAVPLRTARIEGWRLVFRGVADIVPCTGSVVHGGIYSVGTTDILALDHYEGVDANIYSKIVLGDDLFAYAMMRDDPLMMPDDAYLATVRQGYQDWNLPEDQLKAALTAALTE